MTFGNRDKRMTCEEAQLLMSPYMVADPGLSQDQREAFEAHVTVCQACRREYEEDRELIALVREHWPWATQAAEKLLERAGTVALGRDGLTRVTVEGQERESGILRLAGPPGVRPVEHRRGWLLARLGLAAAVAACIVAGAGIGWMTLRSDGTGVSVKPEALVSKSQDSTQASAFAELVTSSGRRSLDLCQPVQTACQPQQVVLGGMHRVVMNSNTAATFCAAAAEHPGQFRRDRATYEVRLSQGEIYVEVVPGHPFIVRTGNALLTIAGTIFDVRAESGQTELTLVEGSVRFRQVGAADHQSVEVVAGHASSIVGRSAPSTPGEVDAVAAVAWARQAILTDLIAQAGPDEDLSDLNPDGWLQPSPPDLDSIDYEAWLESHREWFSRRFPWIFRAQKVLREANGIQADYVELLMISGEVWQFHYPRPWNRLPVVFDPAAVRRVAKHFKVESAHLLKAVAGPEAGVGGPADSVRQSRMDPAEAYLSAMRDWRSDIARAAARGERPPTDLLLFTLRASTYLTNTRTAAHIWIREDSEKAEQQFPQGAFLPKCIEHLLPAGSAGDRGSWLELLGNQSAALHEAASTVQKLLARPVAPVADPQTVLLVRRLSACLDALAPGPAASTQAGMRKE